MSEFDYKPNSNKYKQEQAKNAENEKRIEKVVSGPVKIKKNELRRMADIFVPGDVKTLKDYIWLDVFVPVVKKAVSDIITNGIDILLYGESNHSKRTTDASRVSYRSYYDRREDDRGRCSEPRSRNQPRYDEIVIPTRIEAEEVIDRLDEMIHSYGIVRVTDLYDALGVSCDYTLNRYGWTSVRNAEIVRVRDGGYIIKMPKAMPVD